MSRREKHTCCTEHRTGRRERPDVDTEDAIDGHSVECALVTHFLCARAAFLSRLKNQLHGPLEFELVRFEQLRSPEQHCRVTVMTTGMHPVWNFAAKFNVRLFLDRQCVHIRSQCHTRTVSVPERRDHSSLGKSSFMLDAQLRQCCADQSTGLDLLVCQL